MNVVNLTYHKPYLWLVIAMLACQGCWQSEKSPELPPLTIELSDSDIEFGTKQVSQMMQDREEMATCVRKESIVFRWAVRQFAGEAAGQRIYWWANPPVYSLSFLAIHVQPYKSEKGYISIREEYPVGSMKGKKIPCEQLWSYAVFELLNISNSKEFIDAYEAAINGHISKEEWVTKLTRLEYSSVKRTAEFYETVWRPWATNKGMKTNGEYWFINEPETYDEWIKQYAEVSNYPDDYEKYYDEKVLPYVKATRSSEHQPPNS